MRRFEKNLKRREKKKRRRRVLSFQNNLHKFNDKVETFRDIFELYCPAILKYIVSHEKTSIRIRLGTKKQIHSYLVPKNFSIVENPKEAYAFLSSIVSALLAYRGCKSLTIDYKLCKNIDLGAQVLLDIVLAEVLAFFKICEQKGKKLPSLQLIGKNILEEDIKKMLFSIGTPVNLNGQSIVFQDIIPYKLCIHNRDGVDPISISERKDIDTTELVDYLLESLKRMNIFPDYEEIDYLSTIIGEILINAEEHSTTKYRYSIGYFQEKKSTEGQQYGIFKLIILNFGSTIYDKFKSPSCANQEIVEKMKKLSDSYKKKDYFWGNNFEEETLWTLYSLQEKVSSIDPKVRRRGNGSIKFIESFLNLSNCSDDNDISKMVILSGNTKIFFDGKYKISDRVIGNETCKVMAFNESNDIEDKPDNNYVMKTDYYFPGTIISSRIVFTKPIKYIKNET